MSTRQFKTKVYETKDTEDRFFNLIFPKEALGSYIDDEAKESGILLTFIILALGICGILTTLTYLNVLPQGDVSEKTKDLTLISTIFSWTLFISFMFLLFASTRLFHMSLFVGLIAVTSLSLSGLQNKADKNMILTAIVFASVTLAVVFYYFTLSRTVTDSIEYREKERLVRMENKYKDRIERMREQADKNLDFVKQEREITAKGRDDAIDERDKLAQKLVRRKKEREYLNKKVKALRDHGFHDTDDDSSESD